LAEVIVTFFNDDTFQLIVNSYVPITVTLCDLILFEGVSKLI